MFDAFILAAGLGTRLRPLTEERPKPMVPVCGVPMLEYALASCVQAGFSAVVVNAHWLPDSIQRYEGRFGPLLVHVVFEPELLGTGGGLKNVQSQLASRFVVVNADVLSNVDLAALRRLPPAGGAAMVLRPDPANSSRYGLVLEDGTSTVVALTQVARAASEGEVHPDTHFTGIHAMHVEALDLVPSGFQCIVRTSYRDLVPRRMVKSLVYSGVWLDVGDPSAYLDANLSVLRRQWPLPLDPFDRAAFSHQRPPATAEVAGNLWVGQGAEVSGSRLKNSVIGPNAVVSAGTDLEDCVVWDGAVVPFGKHQRTIFTQKTWFVA